MSRIHWKIKTVDDFVDLVLSADAKKNAYLYSELVRHGIAKAMCYERHCEEWWYHGDDQAFMTIIEYPCYYKVFFKRTDILYSKSHKPYSYSETVKLIERYLQYLSENNENPRFRGLEAVMIYRADKEFHRRKKLGIL